jgi:hypothetical protein
MFHCLQKREKKLMSKICKNMNVVLKSTKILAKQLINLSQKILEFSLQISHEILAKNWALNVDFSLSIDQGRENIT